MIFEENKNIEAFGEKLGYAFAYFLFTTALYLLLALLKDAGYPMGEVTQPPQCAGCPDW